MYENMKHTVVLFGYCVIMMLDVYFIVYCVKSMVKWIRKKIHKDKEPVQEQA